MKILSLVISSLVLVACLAVGKQDNNLIFRKWHVEKVEVDSNYIINVLNTSFLDVLQSETGNAHFDFTKDSILIISRKDISGLLLDSSRFIISENYIYTFNPSKNTRDTALIKSISSNSMVLRFQKQEKKDSFTISFEATSKD